MTDLQRMRLKALSAKEFWSGQELAEFAYLVDLAAQSLSPLGKLFAVRPWSHSVSLLVHAARIITLLGAFFCTVAVTGRYTAGWAVVCSLFYLQLGES